MSAVSRILDAAASGDPLATDQLLPLVYNELRKLAAEKLAHEKPGQTLQGTALVHEAYVRLVDVEKPQQWENRGHFFAAAAEAMRRILVERARSKATTKRGSNIARVDLDKFDPNYCDRAEELLAIDEAIEHLEKHDPQAARLVKLRCFAGLTHQEAAEALGIGRRAADRLWALARAWLYQNLSES
jgi:RNA polymerase sigma factor (TIGR02999 family)